MIGIYYNPCAGSGAKTKQTLQALISKLQASGHIFCMIPNKSEAISSDWLAKNFATITTFIILGGDGTINFIADCLPGLNDITILPVPLGTANIIANHATKSAAANLKISSATNNKGQTKTCLFGASFGFDAAVIAQLAATRKGNINIFSYIVPIIKTLFSFKSQKQAVSINSKSIGNFDFGIIAQTTIYGNSRFKLTSSNEPNTWQALLITNLTFLRLMQALCYGIFSNLKSAPCVSCHKGASFIIKPVTASTSVQIDGEAYSSSPLTITVTNKTLKTLKNINKL
jgi:diacylglycerol kinase family enzyme